jgi:hypothetical protein
MSAQNANAVTITGGSVSGTSITVKDDVFTLQDNLDPTRQARFELSGITTGNTRTYTLPDISATIAVTSLGQTFTGVQTFAAANGNFVTGATTGTTNLASGAVTTGLFKTVNLGTGGLSGSTTAITVGSVNGSTTTLLGTTVIGGAAGNQSLQVNNVASAVNYAQIVGAVAGGIPVISAQGADANVNLGYFTKNVGFHFFFGASGLQASISPTASSVNYVQLAGAATTAAPTISAQGSDANINLTLTPKGTGTVIANSTYGFSTNGGIGIGPAAHYIYQSSTNTLQFKVGSSYMGFVDTAGSMGISSGNPLLFNGWGGVTFKIEGSVGSGTANYLSVGNSLTGIAPIFAAQGTDANIGLVLTGKGTGVVALGGTTAASSSLQVPTVASSVNYVVVSGAATGTSPALGVGGSNANVSFIFQTKGSGGYGFYTNYSTAQLGVSHTASAVNYLQITGAVTTGAPELSAQGSDTNINLKLNPKGTGVLQFGTYTAGVLSPTGYITITDAAGTSRRLLVG